MRKSKVLPEGVTSEMFVLAWQAGTSATAVAAELGMDRRTASQYAGFLRRKGVPLKCMHRLYQSYSDLAALAQRAGEEAK
jgi:hypothetical protein